MIEIETKYNKGDVITINKKDWTVTEIVMRSWWWMYGLEYERKS